MSILIRVSVVITIAIVAATVSAAPVPKFRCEVALIHSTDKKCADALKAMLDDEGFRVELIEASAAGKADFSKYNLILIGRDTETVEWETLASTVDRAEKPILAFGEGGYAFFGRGGLKLAIGSPHGAHDELNGAQGVIPVDAKKSPFWEAAGSTDGKLIPVYKTSGNVQIYVPEAKDGVVLMGREQTSEHHYTIVRQGDRFVLWGYTGVPGDLTTEGKKLFLATCRYTASLTNTKK